MDKLKQWVALTVVASLAILAAGWFLLVSPKRSDAADLRTRTAAQQSTNVGLQAKLDTLRAQQKDLPQQQAALAAVAAKIPDNPALPGLIRALTAAASDTGVELVSLAPATPAAVTPPAGATPTSPSSAATGAARKAAGATTAPRVGAAAMGSALVGSLEQIPVALNVVGGYYQIEQFFDRVEHLSRAMKVVGFSLAPGTSPIKQQPAGSTGVPSTLTGTINAMVYMSSGRLAALGAAPVAAK